MRVSENVRAVQVPEEEPNRPRSTNIYVVGQSEVMSIDSGEGIDKFKWMIRGYLAAIEQTEIGIAGITHHHFDHSGNLKELREALRADIAVPADGVDLLKGRLPDEGVQTLRDGQVINLDSGVRIQIIATPGHSVDSLCYYLEEDGVLFTGDTLLGVGTSTVRDLAAYRQSLDRLVSLPNLRILCPGHGPLVEDARERLQMYIEHRAMREQQILKILRERGPSSSWDIMMEMYQDIDKRLRRSADGNVRAHLSQLEAEGRLVTHFGKPRKPSAEKAKKEKAKSRERQKVIRQARKYEAEERKQTLYFQENPPTDQWSRMPKYELIDPSDAS